MCNQLRELITSMDVRNTLHGGLSEPIVSQYEQELCRELSIRVPGIDKHALLVEINKNLLSIYYFILVCSQGKKIHYPQVIYSNTIPSFVEIERIKIDYEKNGVVIQLPYNRLFKPQQ